MHENKTKRAKLRQSTAKTRRHFAQERNKIILNYTERRIYQTNLI